MGFGLMAGIVVDEELKDKLDAVLEEAREKIFKLIDDNPSHCKLSESNYTYPRGKQTEFNYIEPARWFSLHTKDRKLLINKAFAMEKVKYLFEADTRMGIDEIKAFAQRAIENELDGKGGRL